MTGVLRNVPTARWRTALRAGAFAAALALVAGAPLTAHAAGWGGHGGGGHGGGGHAYAGHGYVGHGNGWGGRGWAGYHPGWGGYYGPRCYYGYGPYCYPPGVTVAIP
jgi:hypothetical protein